MLAVAATSAAITEKNRQLAQNQCRLQNYHACMNALRKLFIDAIDNNKHFAILSPAMPTPHASRSSTISGQPTEKSLSKTACVTISKRCTNHYAGTTKGHLR
jgi:hypothetical protein